MYKKNAQQLDDVLEQIIKQYYVLLNHQSSVVEEFVNDYRNSRQSEIERYKGKLVKNEPAIKPCLLALVLRKKAVTTAKIYEGYLPAENPPLVNMIHLAKISGRYTEHISQQDRNGGYATRRVANMRSLRISTPKQKDWIIEVITQVNELNAVSEKIKNQFLDSILLHYNGHRYLTSLQVMETLT